MASYGCYEQLSRETQEARFKSGLDPICRCDECGVELFIWADVYTFDDGILCDDCGDEYIKKHKKTLSEADCEMEG